MSRVLGCRLLTDYEWRLIAALQAGTCPDCGSDLVHFKRLRSSSEDSSAVVVSGQCSAHGLWELFGDPPTSYRVTA